MSSAIHPSLLIKKVVTLSGILILGRLVQSENARSPIAVTLSGMFTLFKFEHPANASWLMVVIPFGIAMCSKAVQSEKIPDARVIKFWGIFTTYN